MGVTIRPLHALQLSFRRLSGPGVSAGVLVYKKKDGNKSPAEMTSVIGGESQGAFVTPRDITAQRQADETLDGQGTFKITTHHKSEIKMALPS